MLKTNKGIEINKILLQNRTNISIALAIIRRAKIMTFFIMLFIAQ
jgi:hypothetical protein